MKKCAPLAMVAWAIMAVFSSTSCSGGSNASQVKALMTVEPGVFTVDHPELFRLVTVASRRLPRFLTATGTITPDVNSTIHVTSQGSGRVLQIKVRLGDSVHKGQELLLVYSPDLAGAFADYQKAQADERLAKRAFDRAQLLYSRGAFATKDVEQAEDADDKAKADLQNAEQRIRVLGGDLSHPGPTIVLRAPVSGTIVEQNISGFEGVKSLDNSPNLFTIADLSHVWAVSDVYENDLGGVHIGDLAAIHPTAYPDRTFHGRVSDISRLLDPSTRTAKVRIVLGNGSGELRPGMFVTAILESRKETPRLVVPNSAVMRLEDKDWVFRKEGAQRFRQLEVRAAQETSDGLQEIEDGSIQPGQEIVENALEFSTAATGQGK